MIFTEERTEKAKSIGEKNIANMDYIKIKNLCSSESTVKEMKRQATDWEEGFVKRFSDNCLGPERIKNSYRSVMER